MEEFYSPVWQEYLGGVSGIYNRANEMCTFYKRNVQKKDFFSRQTKSVQSVFEQRLNSRLETQNQTLFS